MGRNYFKKVKKVVVDGREIGSIRTVVDVRDKEKRDGIPYNKHRKSPHNYGRKGERKTVTREGMAVYKQANRDKSPKVTYSVPAV